MVTKLALWLDIVSEWGGDVTPIKLPLPISAGKKKVLNKYIRIWNQKTNKTWIKNVYQLFSVMFNSNKEDGKEVPRLFLDTTNILYIFPVSKFSSFAVVTFTVICCKKKKRSFCTSILHSHVHSRLQESITV